MNQAVDSLTQRTSSPLGMVRDEVSALARRLWIHRAVLLAVTRVELGRRYAGSFLGALWYPLYWAILLGMYCFVYIVILRQKLPELGEFGYVLFIFSGLIPYFGISDAIASGTASVRQNMSFVRNAIFPVELIPVKAVLVALVSQAVAVAILAVLAVAAQFGGWHLLYLPVPFLFEVLLLCGVVWALSAINVLVPDIQQVTTLVLWLLLFLSPIGFTISQVPASYRWVVWLNPLTYLIEEFRFALLGTRTMQAPASIALLVAISITFAIVGAVVFRRLMVVFAEYE
ncbi:MAG: ABC transporter permease [bacterium]